jgi:nitrogen fixation protein NifU and related proteins
VSPADLYHQALVTLARSRVGAGRLEAPGGTATRDNPMCGDEATFDVALEGGRIAALAHRVRGCVLCEASAAVLGREAPGRTPAEVDAARGHAAALLAGGTLAPGAWAALRLFAPARDVPSRHTCVLLPFDALADAISRAAAAAQAR